MNDGDVREAEIWFDGAWHVVPTADDQRRLDRSIERWMLATIIILAVGCLLALGGMIYVFTLV